MVTGAGLKETKMAVDSAGGNLRNALSILAKQFPNAKWDHDVKRLPEHADFYKELTGKEQDPIDAEKYAARHQKQLSVVSVLVVNGVPDCYSRNYYLLESRAERLKKLNAKDDIKIYEKIEEYI